MQLVDDRFLSCLDFFRKWLYSYIADTLCCRAVSKYLQTLFVREPVQGRKVLALDHLLVGKTRKEASRMFFETLVCQSKF